MDPLPQRIDDLCKPLDGISISYGQGPSRVDRNDKLDSCSGLRQSIDRTRLSIFMNGQIPRLEPRDEFSTRVINIQQGGYLRKFFNIQRGDLCISLRRSEERRVGKEC